MTGVKLCGMMRMEDIIAVNALKPDYIGFVFAKKSKRYITPEDALRFKELLDPTITAVGVFVDEDIREVVRLLEENVIDAVQLHGHEDESYILQLRQEMMAVIARRGRDKVSAGSLVGRESTSFPETRHGIIKAFVVRNMQDLQNAGNSGADHILLDAGYGNGECFDWELLHEFSRPYFLAGGLHLDNIQTAVEKLHPYAVDVSSGIETGGVKDAVKMQRFVEAVRTWSDKYDNGKGANDHG